MHIQAKKSLGQNFLQDANIAAKIVRALQVAPHDKVVEIGPGPGALTVFLQKSAPAELLLIEKDYYWATERSNQAGTCNLRVITADALEVRWEDFAEPWKFIGNLPYNVASPLMWDIFSRAYGLTRAVFMIQKEVGERLVAKEGGKSYGALSVWVQSHVRPHWEFVVPPQVFKPRPKVDSAVLSFTPVPLAERCSAPKKLSLLLRMCFQQRRKQLGTIFKSHDMPLELLERQGIDPVCRPETLSPQQFQALAVTML